MRVGMCLHHTDQDLFGLWDEWLRQNGEYKDLDPERAWDSFATRVNGERVTIASLFTWPMRHSLVGLLPMTS